MNGGKEVNIMIAKVIKRNGTETYFDTTKIRNAIFKCLKEVYSEDDEQLIWCNKEADRICQEVIRQLQSYNGDKDYICHIEEIQQTIIDTLINEQLHDAVRAYIEYRYIHKMAREGTNSVVDVILRRLQGDVNERSNANVDESSYSGIIHSVGVDGAKKVLLDYVLPKDISEAHKNGVLYQHDLEHYLDMPNCLFLDVNKLATNGVFTRNGDTRGCSNIDSASQMTAVAFQAQSQCQYGGVASMHFDFDLAPFVKLSFMRHLRDAEHFIEGLDYEVLRTPKEMAESFKSFVDTREVVSKRVYNYAYNLTKRETEQAMESLVHNLNTLESRPGSQVPFSSLNFGRDTSEEGRMISFALLKAVEDGVGRYHRTSIFPICIFQLKKGCNRYPGEPNYDLYMRSLSVMSKRIYPNILNCDSTLAHEDENDIDTYFATMGCRTLLGYNRFHDNYKRMGRGNINPMTIILPTLALEANGDVKAFEKRLDEVLLLAEKAHLHRFTEMLKHAPKAAEFAYKNGVYMDADKANELDNIYPALRNGTFAIGVLGMAECCKVLFNKTHAEDEEVHAWALNTIKHIYEFTQVCSERNNLNFSCYFTPAEGLSHTSVKMIRKRFGEVEGVTDKEYLTNSIHVPVSYECSIAEKIDIEAPFHSYGTAGEIFYVELDSMFVKNTKAIEKIVNYAFDKNIAYIAFNFPIDECNSCGHSGEFSERKCPVCNSEEVTQLRRVTGYITRDYVKGFNNGKRQEVEQRIKHDIDEEYLEYNY